MEKIREQEALLFLAAISCKAVMTAGVIRIYALLLALDAGAVALPNFWSRLAVCLGLLLAVAFTDHVIRQNRLRNRDHLLHRMHQAAN